jgi:hypothetical protein
MIGKQKRKTNICVAILLRGKTYAPRYGTEWHVKESSKGIAITDSTRLERVEGNHLLSVPEARHIFQERRNADASEEARIAITHAWRALSVRVLEDSHNFCRLLSS